MRDLPGVPEVLGLPLKSSRILEVSGCRRADASRRTRGTQTGVEEEAKARKNELNDGHQRRSEEAASTQAITSLATGDIPTPHIQKPPAAFS